MKKVATLAMVAYASAESLFHGYGQGAGDLEVDIDGTKSAIYDRTLAIAPWQTQAILQSGTETPKPVYLGVRMDVSFTRCAVCINAKTDIRYDLAGTATGTSTPAWEASIGANPTAEFVDVTFTNAPYYSKWAWIPITSGWSGTVSFRVNATCSQCSNTMEFDRMEAVIMDQDGHLGGWQYIDDRAADEYGGTFGKWGPTMHVNNAVAGDYIVAIHHEISTGGGAVYYGNYWTNTTMYPWNMSVMTMDSTTYDCTIAATATSPGCSNVNSYPPAMMNDFPRVPSASYASGDVPTQMVDVTGPIKVRALVTKRSSAGLQATTFRSAIGLNNVPAAGFTAAPGIVVALVAMLAFAFRA